MLALYIKCVQILLKYGANVNHKDNNGLTALHKAANNGNCDILALLLKGGADINALAKYSNDNSTTKPSVSALLLATQNGNVECVQILLKNGANVNHKSNNGDSALQMAIDHGEKKIVRLLVKAGADTSGVTTKGKLF
jgi:ankyrin repeat protein